MRIILVEPDIGAVDGMPKNVVGVERGGELIASAGDVVACRSTGGGGNLNGTKYFSVNSVGCATKFSGAATQLTHQD